MAPTESPETISSAVVEEAWGGGLRVQNVLCPVDLSDRSENALRYAARIASHFGARLYVQHTFKARRKGSETPEGQTLRVEDLAASQQNAEIDLRAMMQLMGVDSARTTLILNDGDARERIIETISHRAIDLMVIGTRGRKGLARLVQGSLTERVIHEAPCPVLVISRKRSYSPRSSARGSHEAHRLGPLRLGTILVASDLSSNASRLLIYALRWASEAGGKVILFHCVATAPPALGKISDLLTEYDPNLEQSLRGAAERMRAMIPPGAPCQIEYELRDGNALEQLLLFAEDKKPDLIVMGARVLRGAGLVWGSTISGVVRDGRFPVLAVRHMGE